MIIHLCKLHLRNCNSILDVLDPGRRATPNTSYGKLAVVNVEQLQRLSVGFRHARLGRGKYKDNEDIEPQNDSSVRIFTINLQL
jgi:hypothetical protein